MKHLLRTKRNSNQFHLRDQRQGKDQSRTTPTVAERETASNQHTENSARERSRQCVPQRIPCLAHPYGLPKTHKPQLSMQPILSATGTYKLNLKRSDLETLLNLAVKHQLFQFVGNLYEQVDGVAMGSPLGPLLANTSMCLLEE